MKISGNYDAAHWKALTFTSEADWETGIAIFLDRLETRYLKHIRSLLGHRTSGFAALTLDCAVIETLEQFRRGHKENPSWRGQEIFRFIPDQDCFFGVCDRRTGASVLQGDSLWPRSPGGG